MHLIVAGEKSIEKESHFLFPVFGPFLNILAGCGRSW
jgi:hypothetical protein